MSVHSSGQPWADLPSKMTFSDFAKLAQGGVLIDCIQIKAIVKV